MKKLINLGLVLALITSMAACSSRSRVPMEIYSEPLGAHVLMRSSRAATTTGNPEDWIYLGVTPLKITREMSGRELSSSSVVTLRVVRAGSIEQSRDWSGSEIRQSVRGNRMLYWNAQMVPSK